MTQGYDEEDDTYTTGMGTIIVSLHSKDKCAGEFCVIHNPSQHCMSNFPTHWRSDRYLMERICPHGIGHPDPDDMAYKAKLFGDTEVGRRNLHYESIHACCGCCTERDDA